MRMPKEHCLRCVLANSMKPAPPAPAGYSSPLEVVLYACEKYETKYVNVEIFFSVSCQYMAANKILNWMPAFP